MTVLLKKNAGIKLLAFFFFVDDIDGMKCLFAIIIFAFWECWQGANQPRKATQLLDQFDAYLKSKESGWTVVYGGYP